MEPEPRCMEVKLISCKDLRAFNFFQKLTVYATVFIDSEDPKREMTEERRQRQRTLTHRESDDDGSNPDWNHNVRFDLGWFRTRHATPIMTISSSALSSATTASSSAIKSSASAACRSPV